MNGQSNANRRESTLGRVLLVGAGPGDPRLITLWGKQCLEQADVVIYDYLVDQRLLEYAPSTARLISLGHHSRGRALDQEQVNALIREAVQAGQTVVRLKGGDPMIFGRFAEEAEFLQKEGIPTQIIPGVTAAQAASALAEIPLTHVQHASAVAFVAGNEHSYKPESHLDYAALANFPGTLVFYMGVRSAARWTVALIEHGKPRDTPVAVVHRCGWPEQKTLVSTLGDLPELIRQEEIKPPAVIIVGETARHAPLRPWYVRQPLFGLGFLITRAEEQSAELRELLEAYGAYVVSQPAIEIRPPADNRPLDQALRTIETFRWVVFTGVNGVTFFMQRLFALGYDVRQLGCVKLAVIGPGTAATLLKFGLKADLMPEEYRAEKLAECLNQLPERGHILLVRASRGRPVLLEELQRGGWTVTQVVAYTSSDVTSLSPEVLDQLNQGAIHWVTVTSPAIAASVIRLLGDRLRELRIASISPVTSSVLREHHLVPTVEASTYTMRGLVAAILDYVLKEVRHPTSPAR